MKPYLAAALGLFLVLAPLWTLSGFVTVPEFRTGTIADYQVALISGVTLYGGVFVGVLIGECFKTRWSVSGIRRIFVAGIAGATAAITLAIVAYFLTALVSTGRLMPEGQSPALLPVLYIVGGILSAFMAAGVALIAFGLRGRSA